MTLSDETLDRIDTLLRKRARDGWMRGLYGEHELARLRAQLEQAAGWLTENAPPRVREEDQRVRKGVRFSERDVVLSGYLDHVRPAEGQSRAAAFVDLYEAHLAAHYPVVHLLPHFECPVKHPELEGPARRYDGGFEPSSFRPDPWYGPPEDLDRLSARRMYDFVLNHASAQGAWFQRYLAGEPGYERFFFEVPPDLDIEGVARPRTHHPIIEFQTPQGRTKHVWCTFSPTQADLNYGNPRVLAAVVDALFRHFIAEGATWVRLDAVGYLVKKMGLGEGEPRTACFHLKETHAVIKALHALLADVCPAGTLIAEVNDTEDNILTYHGDGDEAHMTYAFPCPPLSLLAHYTGDTRALLEWASRLGPKRIALAFVASHDGIGLVPLDGFARVTPEGGDEKVLVIRELERRGAVINYKRQVTRQRVVERPYEACITLLQAVLTPEERRALEEDRLEDSEIDAVARRFVGVKSYMFSAPHAVPADYLGSVVPLTNDEATFERTGHARDKNRGLVDAGALRRALEAPETARDRLTRAIFELQGRLLSARAAEPAFSPHAHGRVDVVEVPGAPEAARPVWSTLRHPPAGRYSVLCLTNATDAAQRVVARAEALEIPKRGEARDLLSDASHSMPDGVLELELAPRQVAWLRIEPT